MHTHVLKSLPTYVMWQHRNHIGYACLGLLISILSESPTWIKLFFLFQLEVKSHPES